MPGSRLPLAPSVPHRPTGCPTHDVLTPVAARACCQVGAVLAALLYSAAQLQPTTYAPLPPSPLQQIGRIYQAFTGREGSGSVQNIIEARLAGPPGFADLDAGAPLPPPPLPLPPLLLLLLSSTRVH